MTACQHLSALFPLPVKEIGGTFAVRQFAGCSVVIISNILFGSLALPKLPYLGQGLHFSLEEYAFLGVSFTSVYLIRAMERAGEIPLQGLCVNCGESCYIVAINRCMLGIHHFSLLLCPH